MNAARLIWRHSSLHAMAFLAFCLACFAQPESTTNTLVTLTNVQQVLDLTDAELRSGRYEARVRGVIVHTWPALRRIYLQEGRRAVEAGLAESASPYQLGQIVEVTGRLQAFVPNQPRVFEAKARVISEGRLPRPIPASASGLAQGRIPFSFVSVRGMVRDMMTHGSGLTLHMTQNSSLFEVLVTATPNAPLILDWLDAEIEATGVGMPLYNNREQPAGFRLHLQGTNFIKVISPGIANPFDRPTLSIAQAAARPQDWKPRIKVAGTVLAHRAHGAIFIQDDTGVMRIELLPFLPKPASGDFVRRDPQTTLQPGERVEVVGLRHNWFSLTPTLIMAEFRHMGRASVPPPREVSIDDLQKGNYPGRLVSLKARLLDFRGRSGGWSTYQQNLVLHAGDTAFTARWEAEAPAKWELTPNAYVRITGVNEADVSKQKGRASYQLLLRSPADVVQIPEPPFWLRPESRRAIIAGASVALIAAAWIGLQRLHLRRLEHRVAERTTELRAEVAARQAAQDELHVALAAEKELNQLKGSFVSMVSHEFRTPLEVILSSSNILDRYLERLPPEKRKAQLKAIRKSVTRMNDLIEDVLLLGKFDAAGMACQPTAVNLAVFCGRVIAEIESAVSRPGAICMQIEGTNGDAQADEGLLHHILSNLLSNALKYSPPDSPVDLIVARDGLNARFMIRDRGRGIPAADQARLFTAFYRGSNVGQTQGSGLGLVIVKRCIDLHGGTITCESAEGQGATFTVTLPLFDGTRFFRRRTSFADNGAPLQQAVPSVPAEPSANPSIQQPTPPISS